MSLAPFILLVITGIHLEEIVLVVKRVLEKMILIHMNVLFVVVVVKDNFWTLLVLRINALV